MAPQSGQVCEERADHKICYQIDYGSGHKDQDQNTWRTHCPFSHQWRIWPLKIHKKSKNTDKNSTAVIGKISPVRPLRFQSTPGRCDPSIQVKTGPRLLPGSHSRCAGKQKIPKVCQGNEKYADGQALCGKNVRFSCKSSTVSCLEIPIHTHLQYPSMTLYIIAKVI